MNGLKMKENMQIPNEKKGRKLIWHDEFEDSKLNPELWGFARTMNCRDLIYDNSEKHARIEDGKLHLQVHSAGDTYSLCEGVCTSHTMLFQYGYLEMRAKVPFRHAAWPSFWMLGNTPLHDESIGWFAEVDIFEVFSSKNFLVPNLHKWGKAGHEVLPVDENAPKRGYLFDDEENLNNEYHIYGFEWDAHKMSFYVDGECYFSTPIDETSDFVSERFPNLNGYHEPLYVILNNELFTDKQEWYPLGSAVTKEDKMPIDYYIDWVRLYQNPDTERIILGDEIKAAETKK